MIVSTSGNGAPAKISFKMLRTESPEKSADSFCADDATPDGRSAALSLSAALPTLLSAGTSAIRRTFLSSKLAGPALSCFDAPARPRGFFTENPRHAHFSASDGPAPNLSGSWSGQDQAPSSQCSAVLILTVVCPGRMRDMATGCP